MKQKTCCRFCSWFGSLEKGADRVCLAPSTLGVSGADLRPQYCRIARNRRTRALRVSRKSERLRVRFPYLSSASIAALSLARGPWQEDCILGRGLGLLGVQEQYAGRYRAALGGLRARMKASGLAFFVRYTPDGQDTGFFEAGSIRFEEGGSL